MQNTADRMQWVFDNAPDDAHPFALSLLGMGLPAGMVGGNLLSQFFNQAVARGQNPMEVLPWMNGGAVSRPGAGTGSAKDPLASMPQWYRDWYRTQGQHGGVPPVGGLL
jgi:hypothetical protein